MLNPTSTAAAVLRLPAWTNVDVGSVWSQGLEHTSLSLGWVVYREMSGFQVRVCQERTALSILQAQPHPPTHPISIFPPSLSSAEMRGREFSGSVLGLSQEELGVSE